MTIKTQKAMRPQRHNNRWMPFDFILTGVVALVALALRAFGLHWGLPSPQNVQSYHPDEITVIAPTLFMNLFRGEMNPHFFNYGSLFLYAVYFARLFAEGYGWLDMTPLLRALAGGYGWLGVASSPIALVEFAKLHLLARWLSVACGVATVVLVFTWARKAYGRGAASVAAFLLAFFPMHVQHSHFATVDVPLTLLTTLTLYIGVGDGGRGTRMLWAAFIAGLATAVKYSVAPALWLTLAMLWAWRTQWRDRIKRLMLLTVVMAAGFLLGCPYAALSFHEFWRDFAWETFTHSRMGHGYVFADTGSGHWFHLSVNLPAAVGIPAIVLAILGAWFEVRRTALPSEAIMSSNFASRTGHTALLFAIIYFVPLGFAQVRFARYLMPLLPLLALWGGSLWSYSTNLRRSIGPFYRGPIPATFSRLMQGAALLTLAYTFLCGIAIVRLFDPPDSRDEAASWVKKFSEHPRFALLRPVIALHDLPWFYTPPICPLNVGAKPNEFTARAHLELWQVTAPVRIELVDYDLDRLQISEADLFITSDYEYSDRLRLGLSDAKRFYDWLYSNSERVLVFRKEPTLPQGGVFRWYVKPLPHDMRYVNPIVKVFVLKRKG